MFIQIIQQNFPNLESFANFAFEQMLYDYEEQ